MEATTIDSGIPHPVWIDDLFPRLPDLFKRLPNWVRWKLERVEGRDSKIPYVIEADRKAANDNPADWVDYQTAISETFSVDDTEGVGFVIGGEALKIKLVGFDVDGCRNRQTGEITEWAWRLIRCLGSYTEVTPSGFGVRVWVIGDLPDGRRVFTLNPSAGHGDKVRIEVFNHGRYFTITGGLIGDVSEVKSCDLTEAYKLCHEIMQQFPVALKTNDPGYVGDSESSRVKVKQSGTVITTKLELLLHGNIKQKSPFVIEDVYGNSVEYPSQSEADLALATLLAINSKDSEGIAEAFRESSLYRAKWERQDYREGVISKAIKSAEKWKVKNSGQNEVPIVDDSDDDTFEMPGDTFDTRVYEKLANKPTAYPDPGEGDLVSQLARRLVHGTNISLAHCREPLKAIVLHALDGHVIHPVYPDLALRGDYFDLGESDSGKTKGLEFALKSAKPILDMAGIYANSLFVYKSEGAFIRGFSPQGTLKTTKDGKTTGHPGHASQFLYVTEGNQLATCGDYFRAVFSLLMDLYDQTETGTSSLTNGDYKAENVKVSCVICFTPEDHDRTFAGKGSIGGGGHNRWAMVNPPENHDYDDKDWDRLPAAIIQESEAALAKCVFSILTDSTASPIRLIEEPAAEQVRLEVKRILKTAGRVGKRLMDYFVREQVCQAATAIEKPFVMTGAQAQYIKKWVEAQLECRTQNWPADAGNPVETKEHAIRKAVRKHFVSEKVLKDACHFYREGSGGWWAYSTALKNVLLSGAIKYTAKTRKGARAFCPGSCALHPAIPVEK